MSFCAWNHRVRVIVREGGAAFPCSACCHSEMSRNIASEAYSSVGALFWYQVGRQQRGCWAISRSDCSLCIHPHILCGIRADIIDGLDKVFTVIYRKAWTKQFVVIRSHPSSNHLMGIGLPLPYFALLTTDSSIYTTGQVDVDKVWNLFQAHDYPIWNGRRGKK